MLIKCEFCGLEFDRAKNHINYNIKVKRKNLCSRSCAGKMYAKASHDIRRNKKTDEERKFWYLLTQARHNSKTRKKEFNLTIKDIIDQWNIQNGICLISNIPMFLKGKNGKSIPNQASVDRIDCNKGYIKGNIRIVCLLINYAHHTFNDSEMLDFFNIMLQKNPAFLRANCYS